jgi:hypothetical protein
MKKYIGALAVLLFLGKLAVAQPHEHALKESISEGSRKIRCILNCGNTFTWRSADNNPYDVLVLVPRGLPAGRCTIAVTTTPPGIAPTAPHHLGVPPKGYSYEHYAGVTSLSITCTAAANDYPCEFFIADVAAQGLRPEHYLHGPSAGDVPMWCGKSWKYVLFGRTDRHSDFPHSDGWIHLHPEDAPVTIVKQGDCPATYTIDGGPTPAPIATNEVITFTPTHTFELTCGGQRNHGKCRFYLFWHQHR